MDSEIRVGISACLTGQKVRYDGRHKLDRMICDTLGKLVTFVPVCPEVEMGMGVPREPIQLEQSDGDDGAVRLMALESRKDHTEAMERWAHHRLSALAELQLCGYVLRRDSPSCGMDRVEVHGSDGSLRQNGRGLFAQALIERFPGLPVEEDGRLNDPCVRDNFIERVVAFHRLRT